MPKKGISSLSLTRKLGVNYRTAWMVHNMIRQAMSEREKTYALRGMVQLDDAYQGGELSGGKAGRGSENMDRMDGVVCGDLLDRFAATDRLHGNPGLEAGTVGSALAHRWEPLFRGGAPRLRA